MHVSCVCFNGVESVLWVIFSHADLVFMADWWSGTRVKFYIDKDDYKKYYGKEHGYCIMNHTYEIDWLIGWMLADRVHLLGVST